MSIETKLISDLLRLADAVIAARPRLRLSLVSYYVTGRTKMLADLRLGTKRVRANQITVREYSYAIQSFSDNWPAELAWPAGVERPEQTPPHMRREWPQPRRRLTEQERVEMAEAYQRGDRIEAISERFDVDVSYPTQFAKRRGIELRDPRT